MGEICLLWEHLSEGLPNTLAWADEANSKTSNTELFVQIVRLQLEDYCGEAMATGLEDLLATYGLVWHLTELYAVENLLV
ncbi:hypothetical protein Nepgr_015523 [Nepenthes gracilis]|uniref:Uncharacterized protein n=1 Tax=Nepenthes gracilis TaxID=150966 RepID=A0AAD3SNE4_NEPGR|nr:hypothetical protein Nepgr_015523 [Nepenthes gracilis]